MGDSIFEERDEVLHRRLYRFRALVLLLSLSLVGGIVALAEDPVPELPGPVEPEPTEPTEPTGALEGLLRTVEAAEGVSEQTKRQLQDRLLRLADRMGRFGPGVDHEAAIVDELEALRGEDTELTLLVDAILAAYKAGHGFDTIVAILIDLEPDTELDDPALDLLVEIAHEVELAEEDNAALLDALQTEAEATGELNRGQLVSTMAHIRNLERKAQRDGVELTEEQLIELVSESLSGHLSDDEIRAITEAALNSERGMSEAVGHIKNAVKPNGKGRQDASEPDPSEDVDPPSEDEATDPEEPDETDETDEEDEAEVTVTSFSNGNGNGKGNGNGGGAAKGKK